jgi:hypothetical protein
VIDTQISIDRATMRRMEQVIADFTMATGKTAEDGVKRMAKSACKRLATTVHPYGLKGGGKMAKFVKNLELQVGTAWVGTNLGAYPQTSSMAEAHRNARNPSTGRVNARKFRKEKGQPWLDLIPRQEMNAHVKKIQGRAFRAKAAWVKCADDLGKPKMAGVSPLVRRHVDSARGAVEITGKGMESKVTISNNVPWIKKIQYTEDINLSIQEGYKNALSSMQTATKKAIEKANKTLS